jgi:hypothetical protein
VLWIAGDILKEIALPNMWYCLMGASVAEVDNDSLAIVKVVSDSEADD